VAVLSRVLADHPDLRQRLIAAIVPQALRSTVERSVATLPTSAIPFVAGLIGLLFSGSGVVFSAYQTLNHVAAVLYRLRAGFVPRYARVLVMLATLMLGTLAVGALTVVATALPGEPGVRAAAVLGSALAVFAVLLLGARLLLVRPAPVLELARGLTSFRGAFGSRQQTDPIAHLLGTAAGWGGLPNDQALYLGVEPGLPARHYRLKVGAVPVRGFWSVSVYNRDGYFQENEAATR
jgi:hypothetical protein